MNSRLPASLLCLGLVLAGTFTAHGYVAEAEKWTVNRTVRMHLSFTGPGHTLSDGFTSWDQSAADALNIWNSHLTHLKFEVDHNSLLPRAQGDADNSVFFSDNVYGDSWGSGVLAVTLIFARDGIMTETDVLFNSADWSWDSYRGALRSSMDFHRVALHEFGHVVGLDHPDQFGQHVVAIMNSSISNTDSLQADDIAGGQNLFGTGPAYLNGNSAPVLLNISTRVRIDTGDAVMIGGFIIQGSQQATVVLRSIGHSLAANGIANAITDPTIELHDSGGNVIASNDDWISGPDAQTIASYHLDPPNSIESALMATLSPGGYTVVVKGYEDSSTPAATGVGLFELYDLHLVPNSRAGNISTRGQVLTGNDVLIGGFIVGTGSQKTVVVRALGPSLSDAGVVGALSDPTLELHNGQGTLLASNNDWGQGPDAATIQSEGLAPTRSQESALQAQLAPGGYTAIVQGFNGATGLGLVEVYDLSSPPP